ncbi:hypothetical protein [Paraburkholderia youngii]|uniref:hypothetical protein n=1 Tax=Paraburkholderia youngii TaxID=2782701 RepID=UPI003D2622C2
MDTLPGMNALPEECVRLDDACEHIGNHLGKSISVSSLLTLLAEFISLQELSPSHGRHVLWDISGTDLRGVRHDDGDRDLDDIRLIPAGLYAFTFGWEDDAHFFRKLGADDVGSWLPDMVNLALAPPHITRGQPGVRRCLKNVRFAG